ncbi:Aminopeptidase N [Schistosoma japonicum]|nr:Aminopeptidase N [Schistosoma japonicum]
MSNSNNNNNNNSRRDPVKMTNLNKSNNQDGDALDTVIIPLNSSSASRNVHESKSGISKILLILLIILLILLLLFLTIASIIAVYYSNAYYKCQTAKENATDDLLQRALESLSNRSMKDVRLPYTVIPRFYDLKLQVHLHEGNPETFFFNGSVIIKIYCSISTKEFFVHAHNRLNISLDEISISILNENDDSFDDIELKNISYEEDLEWYRIELVHSLQPYTYYELRFGQFRSTLNDELKGWYLSKYMENGTYKYLATSQLQPTDARRVFPCWDEPGFKAQFQVSLIRQKDYHSLSNMALQSTEELHDNWYLDKYEPSVNMSTYLLAFVVSQFASIRGIDSKGRNFTVWARSDKIHSAKYALETGKKIIGFFEEYFELSYPLRKTDMVAVPDFAAGAMENWGLMIYREATMLWDPEYGTAATQQKVATVISHEVAHQWFGNLVTLKWWDDLWLNEGFASFAEYIGVDHVHPEWGMDEQFLLDDIQKVLISDSLATSRPVIQPVYYPNEINEIFDPISYNKGASVLRMMESFMGRNAFRAGVKNYLNQNKYKNTVHEDLWRALTEAAKSVRKDVNVKSVMDTWMKQMNYPLVIVQRNSDGQFHFVQMHYLEPHDAKLPKNPSPYNFTWKIPLTYGSAKTNNWDEPDVIWMMNKTMTQTLDVAENSWYLFNIKQAGFYRVHYADNNWELLTEQLYNDHRAIPLHSRTQILDDLFNLANRATVSYDVYLNLTKYLKNEDQYVAWETTRRALSYLDRMLAMDETYGSFQAYLRTLVDEPLKSIDWTTMKEDKDHMKHMLRLTLTRLACQAEHHACVKMATEYYKKWMLNPQENLIPPSLRPAVYCTAIRIGGQKEWEFLKQRLLEVDIKEDEKSSILQALSCSRDMWVVKLHLDWIIKNNQNDPQDLLDSLSSVALYPIGQTLLWEHIREAWRLIMNEGKNTTQPTSKACVLTVILKILSKRHYTLNNIPDQEEVLAMQTSGQKLLENHVLKRGLNDLFKRSKENIKWTKAHRDVISNWLNEHVPDKTILL